MFPNILIELKKRRYSQQGLAKYIGISRSSMQNKMNGQRPFTLTDGSTTINLFEQNMFAVRAEIEVGFRCDTTVFNKLTGAAKTGS